MAAQENIQLMEIVFGSVLSRGVSAAAEFGVADLIEPGTRGRLPSWRPQRAATSKPCAAACATWRALTFF